MWTISLALMLMLAPPPDSFRIDGQVKSPRRHRSGYATLQTNDGRNVKRVYVGRDGRFGFKNVAEGHYSIVVVMDKARDVRRGIEVDETFADNEGRVKTSIDITDALKDPERFEVSVQELAIPPEARREFRRSSEAGTDRSEIQRRLEKAIALAPDFEEALNNLGAMYLRQGNRSSAIEMFERAVRANPNFFHAHVNLGGVLLLAQEFDRALEENLIAIGLRPEDSLARAQAGIALFNQGRYDEAIPYLLEAQRLDPFALIAPDLVLAQVYDAQGQNEKALASYEEFVRNHPTHPAVRYAQTKIQRLTTSQP